MYCRSYPYESRPDDTVGPAGDLRVSDADRNDVIERLHRHAADGRLTLDEFEARIAEVYKAKTGDELRHTLRELPAEPVGWGRHGSGHRGRPRLIGGPPGRHPWFFAPVALAVAIAVVVVALTPARFPLIPIVFWVTLALVVLRSRRRWRSVRL